MNSEAGGKMNKVKKDVTIYQENFDYVKKVKEERGLSSFSAALDFIISEHKTHTGNQANAVADIIINKLNDEYSNLFTRLRLGVSTADKNSQILIEILNSIILNLNMDKAFSSDVVESTIIRESKETVKERIAYFKQIKDNKNKK